MEAEATLHLRRRWRLVVLRGGAGGGGRVAQPESAAAATSSYFAIHFEQQALDGLRDRRRCRLRGIKVGRVEDYALSGGQHQPRARGGARRPPRAGAHQHGGRRHAQLRHRHRRDHARHPRAAGPPLTEIRADQKLPVIPEGKSNLDALAGKVNQVGDMAAEALENLNDVLKPHNRVAFTETLDNLRKLTTGLNARLGEVDRSIAAMTAAMEDISNSSNRIAKVAESTGGNLGPTIRQAEKTLQDISTAALSLERQVATLSRDFGGAANATEEQLTAAAIELRRTVDSMNRVLDRLQDPRAALLGATPQQRGPGE